MLKILLAVVLTLVAVLVCLILIGLFRSTDLAPKAQYVAYSDFVHAVDAGRVRDVAISGSSLTGTMTDSRAFQTYLPDDSTLVSHLISKEVRVVALPPTDEPAVLRFLLQWLPLMLMTLLPAWVLNRIVRVLSSVDATLKNVLGKSSALDPQ